MTHKKKEPDIGPFFLSFFLGDTSCFTHFTELKNSRACQISAVKPHKTLNEFRSKNKLSRNSPA